MYDEKIQNYLVWQAERMTNALLYSRRKRGENCGELQVKLLKYLTGMLQVIEEDLRIARLSGGEAAWQLKLQKNGVHTEC